MLRIRCITGWVGFWCCPYGILGVRAHLGLVLHAMVPLFLTNWKSDCHRASDLGALNSLHMFLVNIHILY